MFFDNFYGEALLFCHQDKLKYLLLPNPLQKNPKSYFALLYWANYPNFFPIGICNVRIINY
jgi:hypothetical protein